MKKVMNVMRLKTETKENTPAGLDSFINNGGQLVIHIDLPVGRWARSFKAIAIHMKYKAIVCGEKLTRFAYMANGTERST